MAVAHQPISTTPAHQADHPQRTMTTLLQRSVCCMPACDTHTSTFLLAGNYTMAAQSGLAIVLNQVVDKLTRTLSKIGCAASGWTAQLPMQLCNTSQGTLSAVQPPKHNVQNLTQQLGRVIPAATAMTSDSSTTSHTSHSTQHKSSRLAVSLASQPPHCHP